jgi:hypothetical protein
VTLQEVRDIVLAVTAWFVLVALFWRVVGLLGFIRACCLVRVRHRSSSAADLTKALERARLKVEQSQRSFDEAMRLSLLFGRVRRHLLRRARFALLLHRPLARRTEHRLSFVRGLDHVPTKLTLRSSVRLASLLVPEHRRVAILNDLGADQGSVARPTLQAVLALARVGFHHRWSALVRLLGFAPLEYWFRGATERALALRLGLGGFTTSVGLNLSNRQAAAWLLVLVGLLWVGRLIADERRRAQGLYVDDLEASSLSENEAQTRS